MLTAKRFCQRKERNETENTNWGKYFITPVEILCQKKNTPNFLFQTF